MRNATMRSTGINIVDYLCHCLGPTVFGYFHSGTLIISTGFPEWITGSCYMHVQRTCALIPVVNAQCNIVKMLPFMGLSFRSYHG